jgi:hypothetical protein
MSAAFSSEDGVSEKLRRGPRSGGGAGTSPLPWLSFAFATDRGRLRSESLVSAAATPVTMS